MEGLACLKASWTETMTSHGCSKSNTEMTPDLPLPLVTSKWQSCTDMCNKYFIRFLKRAIIPALDK